MTQDPDYYDFVHRYFLELTGRGLVLSSRDLNLLKTWREAGVSAAIVCQGIDRAVQEIKNPRDIYGCKKFIDPLVERAMRLSVGGHQGDQPEVVPVTSRAPEFVLEPKPEPDPIDDPVLQDLNRAFEAAERDAFKDAYKLAIERVASETGFEALIEAERLLVEAYFEALKPEEKEDVEHAVNKGVNLDALSEAARLEHIHSRRRRILIERYGLVPLV